MHSPCEVVEERRASGPYAWQLRPLPANQLLGRALAANFQITLPTVWMVLLVAHLRDRDLHARAVSRLLLEVIYMGKFPQSGPAPHGPQMATVAARSKRSGPTGICTALPNGCTVLTLARPYRLTNRV